LGVIRYFEVLSTASSKFGGSGPHLSLNFIQIAGEDDLQIRDPRVLGDSLDPIPHPCNHENEPHKVERRGQESSGIEESAAQEFHGSLSAKLGRLQMRFQRDDAKVKIAYVGAQLAIRQAA
jgi:hypothetical protein